MLVVAASPSSSSALRSWARLSSAFLIAAIEVGPLIPGVMALRLSPGIVLAAVRIARPEHQYERFVARLEHRQHDLGRDVGEIGLLRDVGDGGPRRLGHRPCLVAARGRRQRQIRLGQCVLHLSDRGTPVLPPVESSTTMVYLPRSVWSKNSAGRACRRRGRKPLVAAISKWFPHKSSRH